MCLSLNVKLFFRLNSLLLKAFFNPFCCSLSPTLQFKKVRVGQTSQANRWTIAKSFFHIWNSPAAGFNRPAPSVSPSMSRKIHFSFTFDLFHLSLTIVHYPLVVLFITEPLCPKRYSSPKIYFTNQMPLQWSKDFQCNEWTGIICSILNGV